MPDDLQPAVGIALTGNGKVAEHRILVDTLGRAHGLYCLTIQGQKRKPDLNAWVSMLPETASVKQVRPHVKFRNWWNIYYKLGE